MSDTSETLKIASHQMSQAMQQNQILTAALQDAHQTFVHIRTKGMHWKESHIVAAQALEAIQLAFEKTELVKVND